MSQISFFLVDPFLILESFVLLVTACYLGRLLFTDGIFKSGATFSSTILDGYPSESQRGIISRFALLFQVGALISTPKRSLQSQQVSSFR